jgi:hypothetical protein
MEKNYKKRKYMPSPRIELGIFAFHAKSGIQVRRVTTAP